MPRPLRGSARSGGTGSSTLRRCSTATTSSVVSTAGPPPPDAAASRTRPRRLRQQHRSDCYTHQHALACSATIASDAALSRAVCAPRPLSSATPRRRCAARVHERGDDSLAVRVTRRRLPHAGLRGRAPTSSAAAARTSTSATNGQGVGPERRPSAPYRLDAYVAGPQLPCRAMRGRDGRSARHVIGGDGLLGDGAFDLGYRASRGLQRSAAVAESTTSKLRVSAR